MSSCNSPIMIIILFFLIVPCVAAQLSFNFPYFTPNIREINYYGDATSSDPVIQLTRNQKDRNLIRSSGRIMYSKEMQLWDKASGSLADFRTHFTFIIKSQNRSIYGDGITFFLAPVGFPLPNVQNGSGIGLVSGDQIFNSTLNPFVAVEFDTFQNTWDPPYDHVGININSMISVKDKTWNSSIPTGQMNEAWISYNSSTKNLRVVYTGFSSDNSTFKQILYYNVDLRNYLPEFITFGFSAATGDYAEIHTLHSWDFSSSLQIDITNPVGLNPVGEPPPNPNRNRRDNREVIVGLVAGASVCVLISGMFFLWVRSRRKGKITEKEDKRSFDVSHEFGYETGPKKFSYKELAIATKDFVEDVKVGEGGFGGVYKGFLKELNSDVAIKRVSKESKQGIKEYASEVKIISRLRHRNLVQLIGWCHEESELLLVYEFMPNGSLDSHLFKENSLLTWVMRYNITRGLASALLYLHEEWEQCVLHRDIKSSNIMLDSNFNAKLGDFGLARFVDHEKESQTTVLAGTMGYMAPESVMTGKASKGSDVYSFGVVALEIASGRKPIDRMAKANQTRLVDQIWELYGKGKLFEAADPKLSADFDAKQMECLLIVGLWCCHPDHKFRPSMRQAIQVLNFEAPLPSLPPTTPVATYSAAAMDLSAVSLSSSYGLTVVERCQSSSSSYNTNSSKVTTSATAASSTALILHTQEV